MIPKFTTIIALVLVMALGGWLCNTMKQRSDYPVDAGTSDTITKNGDNNTGGNNDNKVPVSDNFPIIAKPKPVAQDFNGCPPEGDGGDPELNTLKNRIDEGNYVSVSFDAIMNLTWPQTIEQRNRRKWSSADKDEIAKYEGTPVVVEGYFVKSKKSGSESCNCHGAGEGNADYHVWLTKSPDDDRTKSIVIEPTPRIKTNKPNWDLYHIGRLILDKNKVRVSGWLLMDPEHPDEIGKTRGTIWEIHPVMKIEYKVGDSWKEL